jgi:hypothetical protein
MKTGRNTLKSNANFAQNLWGKMSRSSLRTLRELTKRHQLSVMSGDVQYLDGRWYVTHTGLLGLALRRKCAGIRTALQKDVSNPTTSQWVFKATVYKSRGSCGFVGYGDADPTNVSSVVRGCELRIAETRAVNRALRKAYGIGLCSVEELGALSSPARSSSSPSPSNGSPFSNGSNSGRPRLRDQLCLLIRQFNLDPTLVKRYAADFCGTDSLKEASRDLVESFVTQLAASAKKDRDALVCKLNSYAPSVEAKP